MALGWKMLYIIHSQFLFPTRQEAYSNEEVFWPNSEASKSYDFIAFFLSPPRPEKV